MPKVETAAKTMPKVETAAKTIPKVEMGKGAPPPPPPPPPGGGSETAPAKTAPPEVKKDIEYKGIELTDDMKELLKKEPKNKKNTCWMGSGIN